MVPIDLALASVGFSLGVWDFHGIQIPILTKMEANGAGKDRPVSSCAVYFLYAPSLGSGLALSGTLLQRSAKAP